MYRMNYIGKFISNFRDFYNEINAATLTGAIDVVVVEQPDGSFTCSPFHVRFGKLGVLRSREKVVDIEINGESLDIHMKLGDSGEAFFVEEVTPSELGDDEVIPPHLACSPIPDDNFLLHFHGRGATITEIHDNTINLHEKNVDVTYSLQESRCEGIQNYESNVDSSQVQSQMSSRDGSAESCVTKENVDLQKHVITAGTSVPKTFCAETVTNDDELEKVHRINIAAADFRPISLIVEEGVSAIKGDEDLLVEDSLDGQNATEESSSCQEQSSNSSHGLVAKENIVPGSEDLAKANSGGKRKRRKKSFMKKKAAAQRKYGVGSNSQIEHMEANDANGLLKASVEMQQTVTDDSSDQGIFQIDDLNGQAEAGSSSKRGPSGHLGGNIISNTESTIYNSAVESGLTTSLAVGHGTAASAVSGVAGPRMDTAGELARIQHASSETDFHFFSDTDATPGCGPHDSRPCSPVQSDTEFEINRQSKAVSEEEDEGARKSALHGQSWRWGELPSPPPRSLLTSHNSQMSVNAVELADPEPVLSSEREGNIRQQEVTAAEAEAQRSMLSGMFSFMKKTKRIRHNPESEGIYLSDLNSEELDPEVAALYFPTSYRQGGHAAHHASVETRDEEDAESGNGTSLPHSPHSVEGAIGGPKSLDSAYEELKHSDFEKKSYGEISLSLCGGLTAADGNMSGPTEDSFLQGLVTYSDLLQNPKLIDNPDLVARFNGKYYNWKVACPLVMSLVVFQRPLPQDVVDSLVAEYMPVEGKNQKKPANQQEASRGTRGYSSWFYWRRPSEPKKISSNLCTSDVSSPETEKVSDVKEVVTSEGEQQSVSRLEGEMTDEGHIKQSEEVSVDIPDGADLFTKMDETGVADENKLHDDPVHLDRQKEVKEEGYSGSNSSDESDSGRSKLQSVKLPIQRRSYYDHTEKYRKTLRLSSDQIASLNLNEGANEVVFSVTTAYQGTTRCKCHIYKWRFDDKIVISDIDGTITKSDVLGHILPIVGKDWAQSGVAQLFTKIKNNGYRLLYLSARAIGQARVTREYLRSIKQGDLSLPDGPLLLNPTSLISAFHREVIEKKPEEFKISCLRDIQALFPVNSKPFYAGYGNKVNDVWAYRAVGIPIFRIFTINHRGELKHELTQTFQSSYSNMSYIVDQMFPPPPEDTSEDFSNFVYWRDPIPDLVVDAHLHPPVNASTTEDTRMAVASK
ncbi:phosphatidate phosphatase LPIN2 isoform X2 [Zootermopsis nevadensis]|uniref:phosphatidate phosphatase n=1 Tax=Zootermopsis nevadensis TaxID=136037 RepID=A0A067RVD1_ZOONE|nr:phosphatidate phosphatase LPIN2 isoform X2 [Zootermopsis nevadensis]KDR23839.1 Lipin-3 [Zootermopsis nevadensis]